MRSPDKLAGAGTIAESRDQVVGPDRERKGGGRHMGARDRGKHVSRGYHLVVDGLREETGSALDPFSRGRTVARGRGSDRSDIITRSSLSHAWKESHGRRVSGHREIR